MEQHIVKILGIENVTHNVRRFNFEKPAAYSFKPGQATEVSVNKPGFEEEKRPFTFTGLNEWSHLQFTIKIYSDHNGVTNKLGTLVPGDELIIRDVWGTIEYKGPGYFIAGGAGITPFIAILRNLYKENKLEDNKLIFSNRTKDDIILKDEFEKMLGNNFINVLTQDPGSKYKRIDFNFINECITDFTKNFYVCGPDQFVADINDILKKLGANPDLIIFEK